MHYVSCSIDLFCFLRTKNQTASLLWQGKPFQGKGQEGTDVKNKISSPFLGQVGEGPAQIAPRWPMTCEWKQPHTSVPTLYRAHSTAAGLRGFQSTDGPRAQNTTRLFKENICRSLDQRSLSVKHQTLSFLLSIQAAVAISPLILQSMAWGTVLALICHYLTKPCRHQKSTK